MKGSDIIVLSVLTLLRVALANLLNGKTVQSGRTRTHFGSAVWQALCLLLQQASSSFMILMDGEPSIQGGH